ncbi:MAG TPA: ATP-binding protein [Thermoanaerobaculia bacterium]|nr:ATP-binding protein [Thermoanaerobaculia bacterium]
MPPVPFERFWRRLDPRASIAARLLVGFFLAFLLPGALLVFLIAKRLTGLQTASAEQVAAVRIAEFQMRMAQDAGFRAEWLDRRARAPEEAAWALAASAALALNDSRPPSGDPSRLVADRDGHLWTEIPEDESVALVSARADDPALARRDAVRLRALAPLMAELRVRRPAIRAVGVWTASGAARLSPWLEFHRANRESGGELERFVFNRVAKFPEARPADGDTAVWTGLYAGPMVSREDQRLTSVMVPVRNAAGRLVGGVSLDVDPRRYVAETFESWEPVGDFWFATDGAGHALSMMPRAAAVLGWGGVGGTVLSDAPSPELKKLALRALRQPRSEAEYDVDGKMLRVVSARAPETGWVLFEGLSEEALAAIRADAVRAFPPASYSDLKRDVFLLFAVLSLAVLALVFFVSRRLSAPVGGLVRAAEEIGRGRPVEVAVPAGGDEIARLAAAIDAMGKRVSRRVETLRRLHQFSRSAYRMTDVAEVLARSTQAIAAFTGAERVWFHLYDRHTNRLEAALPAWNLPAGLAEKLKVSVDTRSIAGLVFRTGESYCANDLDRDPYTNRELQKAIGAHNAVFAPLKTEEETLGVAAAVNRAGGFGQEEVDGMTSFADLASLLLRNARLYGTLVSTVDELRHASRLKDHFLQNVNHELRTPLTAIVGWTDLFEEEEALDEKTLRRGLRQIRQSARVLLALIDDLLDLARLERGALQLDLKPVSLSEVIQRSVETVRLMSEARGVVMILAPLPEPMPPVRADPLRLQQILWNLLANAIQFTPQHGRVVVRVEREPERYLVSVEDDGIGIPESELPHVFERFRQVDGSATRGHAGMGIGLALARSLVELHGGSIWASSVVGQGSRFTFALPIRPAERRSAEPVASGARAPRGATS